MDIQAITILLYLSRNPKTRSELMIELKEIPLASLYRKINKLEKFGLIRSTIYKKEKRTMYESITQNFVIQNRGKFIHIIIS